MNKIYYFIIYTHYKVINIMDNLTGFLIVTVVILILLILFNNGKPLNIWPLGKNIKSIPSQVISKVTDSGAMLFNKSKVDKLSPEAAAMKENTEYFQACSGDNETEQALGCLCGDGDKFTFAKHDWGSKGMDYGSFMTSQAVDDETIKHHSGFVKDRLGDGNFTGRTYSPDSHESYDPIKWVGLRRPQYVEQCNPTQVPDVNTALFKSNRQFCFKT